MNVLDALAEATQSLLMHARRFPAPWSVEELEASFRRARRKRPRAKLRLFRRGARATISDEATHQR
jgi:hypothetical protein